MDVIGCARYLICVRSEHKENKELLFIMSKDIVSEMVQQMGLTPQMVDRMQDPGQGQGYQQPYPGGGMQGGMGGGMPGGMGGLPSTAEEQMRLLQEAQTAAQSHHAPPAEDYRPAVAPEEGDDSSDASTESDIDLEQIGLGHSRSTIDIIMEYLKDPIVVLVLYIILNLPQMDTLIRRTLPSSISGNVYYYLGIRASLLFGTYLLTRLVLL